jgi:hypothetical protein
VIAVAWPFVLLWCTWRTLPCTCGRFPTRRSQSRGRVSEDESTTPTTSSDETTSDGGDSAAPLLAIGRALEPWMSLGTQKDPTNCDLCMSVIGRSSVEIAAV